MKLRELLTERIDLSKSTKVNLQGHQWLPVSGDLAGEGVQARVYKTGLGMVTKVAVLDEDLGLNDPSVKFLELILNHQDNPFFPKIYHARVYRDAEGVLDPILLVQMEKLIPTTDPKVRDAAAGLFNQLRIGTRELSPGLKKHLKQYDRSTQDILSKSTALKQKLYTTSSPKDIVKLASRSQNPQFREAMKVLAPAFQKYGSDLHHGNWMVRLTGVGPQLVIVDPFVPSGNPNAAPTP